MDGYNDRDELFPPAYLSTKNTPWPRYLTITGVHRHDFKDKDTNEIRNKPCLEFAETTAIWAFSATAYDRLAEQLNESRVQVWIENRVRIKLYTSKGVIFVNDEPVEMLIADALDTEEWEALQEKKKLKREAAAAAANGKDLPLKQDLSDSIPF